MERKRLQQQKMKEQQRFCVSQQDLRDAIAQMKPVKPNLLKRSYSTNDDFSILQTTEQIQTRSVSQLIQEYESRSYASAQDLLPVVNDVLTNGTASNCSHMFKRTMKIKDNTNDNDIINNNVCSPISFLLIDDNQMVTEDLHREKIITDKEREEEDDDGVMEKTRTSMLTRSTDIDKAEITLNKQHEIDFDELISKEEQLNHALADLLSISNNIENRSSTPTTHLNCQKQQNVDKKKTNSISASIELLNNLLQTFDSHDEPTPVKPINMFCLMLSDNICANCHQSFATNEQIVNAAGQLWHTHCFVCTQCFQPFENGLYFEHENRKYCEKDFQMLFAPCCGECKKAIVGRVIRAVQKCFHPDCFRCQLCQISLIERGFFKINNKVFCRDCHAKEKVKELQFSQHICSKCHQIIDTKSLKFQGEFYHPHHFQCTSCQTELDETSREIENSLYCLSCSSQLDLPVCAACHRFINERIVYALGKPWHAEHFSCAHCARPFDGNKYFEHQGLAYCETDYHSLFGSTCFICKQILIDNVYTVGKKTYCFEHFTCSLCDKQMNDKSKYFDVDARPVCKHCYKRFPSTIRKSIKQTSV